MFQPKFVYKILTVTKSMHILTTFIMEVGQKLPTYVCIYHDEL